MKLSRTGSKWIEVMGRIYAWDQIAPVIERAERVSHERAGRFITREDLNEALDSIAQQELVADIMLVQGVAKWTVKE